jgi:hypothetical protein
MGCRCSPVIVACVALGVAVAGATATPRADAEGTSLTVSIVGPAASEMSAWTDLRLAVGNAAADPVQARVTVRLSAGHTRPAVATGGRCAGSGPVVECEISLPAYGTGSLAIPVRWDGYGRRAIDAGVQVASSPAGEPGVSTTAIVLVYTLALRDLRTSPSPARAGRPLVATATLVRSDTHAPLAAHSLRCPAVIAAVPNGQPLAVLRGRPTHHGSRLACLWNIPAEARSRFVRALVLSDTHPGGMTTKYPFWRAVR